MSISCAERGDEIGFGMEFGGRRGFVIEGFGGRQDNQHFLHLNLQVGAMIPKRIVIDTNVCLDLFVFRDARWAALLAALRDGTLQAVTRADCRDEWQIVLATRTCRWTTASRRGYRARIRCADRPAWRLNQARRTRRYGCPCARTRTTRNSWSWRATPRRRNPDHQGQGAAQAGEKDRARRAVFDHGARDLAVAAGRGRRRGARIGFFDRLLLADESVSRSRS